MYGKVGRKAGFFALINWGRGIFENPPSPIDMPGRRKIVERKVAEKRRMRRRGGCRIIEGRRK